MEKNGAFSRCDNSSEDKSFNFIVNCMNQNLEHTRHVEMERMTFNSIFLALVAGTLVVISQSACTIMSLLCLLILLMDFIAIVLTWRWNETIKEHVERAKECYDIIQSDFLDKSRADQSLYFFEFKRGIASIGKIELRTRHLFYIFQFSVFVIFIYIFLT